MNDLYKAIGISKQAVHNHLNRETPEKFREKIINLLSQARPMVTIYTEGNKRY